MYKYKYFLLFFAAIGVLLLWNLFPVSFDNNDDQVMFAICSGLCSGTSSSNLILSNIVIGKALSTLFQFSKEINFYTLYLQIVLLFSFLIICLYFLRNKQSNFTTATLIIFSLFTGFFSLSFVKLQFTTVALFCTFSALFCLQMQLKSSAKVLLTVIFIAISILIRKEVFYIFILYSLAALVIKRKEENFIKDYIITLFIAVIIFSISVFINDNNKRYTEQHTYSNINTIDILAAKPLEINEALLYENNFTKNDLALMQNWLVADDNYLSGKRTEQLALGLKSTRNFNEVCLEIKKFVKDERYLLFIYLLTAIVVVFFVRRVYSGVLLNLIVFSGILFYLTITSRIPHRFTYPMLTYLVLFNLSLISESNIKKVFKTVIFSVLLTICCYKFYCTTKLIDKQNNYHRIFNSCQLEINAHPENLFIAADGFPLLYMDAWQSPEKNFPARNLILGGWYACSPDYQGLLKFHGIKNLTSDLRKKNNVLFLTDSEVLQKAYIKVLKERYNINCHFEECTQGFKTLQPKRLVFDNQLKTTL